MAEASLYYPTDDASVNNYVNEQHQSTATTINNSTSNSNNNNNNNNNSIETTTNDNENSTNHQQDLLLAAAAHSIVQAAAAATIPEDVIATNEDSNENSTVKSDDDLMHHQPLKDANEETVESPTTVETFTFKCVFCEQVLNSSDEPKLLECLHCSCGHCIGNKLYEQNETGAEKSPIQCPQCVMLLDPNKIIENQFLLELANTDDNINMKTATDIKCSSCNDDANASSWCVDCSEYICDNCVQAHQRLKITKDHTIKPKEDANDSATTNNVHQNNLFCLVHPHERLSLFCETCDRLTCRDCQLIEHREHRYKFTNEIAAETRKFIGDMLKDVGYKRILLSSAMKVIDDRQTLIVDKKQALVREITQLVVKLTNTINVRGKQLVTKLTEVCDSKQKTLQEKKEALEQLSMMTDHCIEFTQHALDNGSDMALLYSKKQVTDHLKRIKRKRADIPNPDIPVRIHLALDKVPELIKVMSTIGQIVVDGRVYPSQANSPLNSLPPPGQGSPSPGHQNRPPQQQSPISPMLLQRKSPSNFPQTVSFPPQTTRLPPPYNNNHQQQQQQYPSSPQYQQQNNIMHNQNVNHQGQKLMPPNMGPPAMTPINQAAAISLTQQLNMPSILRMQQRPQQLQRPLLPRLPQNNNNSLTTTTTLNQHQQQVSSSTHPQGLLHDRSNLRGLLQTTNQSNNTSSNNININNAVYVQTGPSQYQAVQPHLAQQFQQNRFPSNQQSLQQQQIQFRQQQQQHHPFRMLLQNHQQQHQQQQVVQQQQQQHQQQRQQLQQQHLQQQQQQQQQHHQQLQQHQVNRPNIQQQQQHRPPPGQLFQSPGSAAKWHIPQQNATVNHFGPNRNMVLPTINDNFKITLKQQSLPATVTSTIPKTPSPNHIQNNTKSDTERNIDKFCQDSVNDLIATIAKLDSNGVQVLAEGGRQQKTTGGSPLVDSSTGDGGPAIIKIKNDPMDTGKDDPNEDWCAVCMDGGELVCCDKCPKVFHQYCHIPNLSVEENDTWQCLLCMNFADIPEIMLSEKQVGELSLREKKIIERIVLELYCQYDPSLPFREVIGPEIVDYHTIIKNPIALDSIRQKLNWDGANHYTSVDHLIRDVRLMFKNAYTYNSIDSPVYNDAKTLESFFDQMLERFLPEYIYEDNVEDDDLQPPNKKLRRIMTD